MKPSKIRALVLDNFVYKTTILLLGLWVIILANKKRPILKNTDGPPKTIIIEPIKNSKETFNPEKEIQEQGNKSLSTEEKERELISKVLTNSFKESKKKNSKTIIEEPIIQNSTKIVDEEENKLLEVIEIGRTLRENGKTLESLKAFREAKTLFPNKLILMWELHLTYEVMSLHEKSRNELNNILAIGKGERGEYWEMAKLKVMVDGGRKIQKIGQRLLFEQVIESSPINQEKGETILIKMEIISKLKDSIDVKDITLILEFYDIVNDSEVQPTLSDQPSATWKTSPVDWESANTEIVEWKYYLPNVSMAEKKIHGKRKYYGFVARLYYKDLLQDIYAKPRILLEPKQSLNRSFIDSSLFPPENN